MEAKNYGDVTYINILNTNMGAHINVYLYLVDGLLIDCGPEIMQEEIAEFLEEYKPRAVVLTHLHEDHCGMAAWIEQRLGIPIYVADADIAEAAADADYAEYRHLTWGDRRAFSARPLESEIRTEKHIFKVLDTPGHIANHSVLFEESSGWLFSGDLYVRSHPRFAAPEEDASKMIESLRSVLALPFTTVFCAHAGIMENGREKLEKKLNYLLELQETVRGKRALGMNDEEIDRELFDEEQLITVVSGGEWTSLNLIKTL